MIGFQPTQSYISVFSYINKVFNLKTGQESFIFISVELFFLISLTL